MYTNREGCTIYEKTVQNRAPTYIRHVTGEVFAETTFSQENGSDRKPDNGLFISIPAKSVTYVPKTDDRIVCGISRTLCIIFVTDLSNISLLDF